ncbi:MAG: hypothetical protein K6G16_03490 [Lachnospiraceae bacterium]|nr:hypothetical protein [Lachnospiraceae bacterium]
MERQIFRKKSLERLSSPEELNDYLHVTQPSVWVLLAAVILLLTGLFIWSAFTAVESSVKGTGTVRDGVMTVTFDDRVPQDQITAGMEVSVGGTRAVLNAVGTDEEGNLIAAAQISVPDGTYDASVRYRQTRIIRMLIN